MKVKELQENLNKCEAYKTLYQQIQNKDFVNEETLISEEAENLYKNYEYVYLKTGKEFYRKNCAFLKKAMLSYKNFNEVLDLVRDELFTFPDLKEKDLLKKLQFSPKLGKGIKYSIFKEVINFLKL